MGTKLQEYGPLDLLNELKISSPYALAQAHTLFGFFKAQVRSNNQSYGIQQVINPDTADEKILVDPQIFRLAIFQYRAGGMSALRNETHYPINLYVLETACDLSRQDAERLYTHLKIKTQHQKPSTTQTIMLELNEEGSELRLPKSNVSQFSEAVTAFKTSIRAIERQSTVAPPRDQGQPSSRFTNQSVSTSDQQTTPPPMGNQSPGEQGPLYTVTGLIALYRELGGPHSFQGVEQSMLNDLVRMRLIKIGTDRGIFRIDDRLGEQINLSGIAPLSPKSRRELLNEIQLALYDTLANKGYLRGVNVTEIRFAKIRIEPGLQSALRKNGISTMPYYEPQDKAPSNVRKMTTQANAHIKALLDTYREQLTIYHASDAYKQGSTKERQDGLKNIATKFAIAIKAERSQMNDFMKVNETLRENTSDGKRYRRRFNQEFLKEDRDRSRLYENRIYAVDALAAAYEQNVSTRGLLQGVDRKVLKLHFSKAAIEYAKEKWRLPTGDDDGVKPKINLAGITLSEFIEDIHQRVSVRLNKEKALNGVSVFATTIDRINPPLRLDIEPNTLSETLQRIMAAYPQLQIPLYEAQPYASAQVKATIQAGTERVRDIARKLILETAKYIQSSAYTEADSEQKATAIKKIAARYESSFGTDAEKTRKTVKSMVAPFLLAHEYLPEPANSIYTSDQLRALYDHTGVASRFQGIPNQEMSEIFHDSLIKHAKSKGVYMEDNKSEDRFDLSGIGIDTFMKGVHARFADKLAKARYLRTINIFISPVANAPVNVETRTSLQHLGIMSLPRYEPQRGAPPRVKQLAAFQNDKIQSLLAIADDTVTTYKQSLQFPMDTPQIRQKKIHGLLTDIAKDITRTQKQFADDIEQISISQTERSVLHSRNASANNGKVDAGQLLSQRKLDTAIEEISSKKRKEIEAKARCIKYFGAPETPLAEKFAFTKASVRSAIFRYRPVSPSSANGTDTALAVKVIDQVKKDLAFNRTQRKDIEKQLQKLGKKAPFRQRFLGSSYVYNQRRAFLRKLIADAKHEENYANAVIIKATELLRQKKLSSEMIDSIAKMQSDTTRRDEWKQIADMSKKAGMRQNPERLDADQTNNRIEPGSEVVLKDGNDSRAYIKRSTAGSQHNHWRVALLEGDSKIQHGSSFKSVAELQTGDIVGGQIITTGNSLTHTPLQSSNTTVAQQTHSTGNRKR